MRWPPAVRLRATGLALAWGIASAVTAQTTQPSTIPGEARSPTPAVSTRPAGDVPTAPATQPAATDPIAAIKQPVPWFRWGLDYRLRWEYLDNGFTLNRHTPDDEWNFQRLRPRLSGSLAPAPGLELNTRFMWESRHWCSPDSKPTWEWNDGLFDQMNLKIKVPDTPATLTIGRQDIILGDGWLVLEGTPLDGSRTIYFDAARLNLDLKEAKTTADVIYIQQYSDTDAWLPPIRDQDRPQIEQDEIGAILYVSNKSITRTQIDGYFIYKDDEDVLPNGDDGDVYTFGGRAVHDFTDHVVGKTEAAYQFGERNEQELCAFGTANRLAYLFRDPWKNQLKLGYEFLSGDDPETDNNEAFDPLWGRWPQWSELYIYTWATETRISEATNLHRLAFGWQMDPTDRLGLGVDYHLLFAARNTYEGRAGFSDHGSFRGQLMTAILRYKINRFLAGHVMGEYFIPGDYYAEPRDDPAAYLRAELVFTF